MMNLVLNILGKLIVTGFWIGTGYFLFFYPETTAKMQVGIIITIVMMIFLNGLFCIALRFAAEGITEVKKTDYLLIILFGFFGCNDLRSRIMASLRTQLEQKSKNTSSTKDE